MAAQHTRGRRGVLPSSSRARVQAAAALANRPPSSLAFRKNEDVAAAPTPRQPRPDQHQLHRRDGGGCNHPGGRCVREKKEEEEERRRRKKLAARAPFLSFWPSHFYLHTCAFCVKGKRPTLFPLSFSFSPYPLHIHYHPLQPSLAAPCARRHTSHHPNHTPGRRPTPPPFSRTTAPRTPTTPPCCWQRWQMVVRM